ncbi:DUF4382 domain-containing protein [Halorubrum sp. SP9]|uniref:DUF4382 domain-containing protein n=1 Tax=Halorubrum sp. SP9 TaxID=1537267 RepID=UPI0010F48547|nr:DUF4382 domain-containing protein [Halorubrum sp. SP9]TKX67907.1 DUF4382 domain-containing protein [Halorubrum sp. SP9]
MTDRSRTTGGDESRTTGDGGSGPADGGRSADASADGVRRREFVALGAGASATLLAGCAGDGSLPSAGGSDGSDGSDGSGGSETLTGNFRLLISDAPADIGDFDRLDVTLDRARVFEAGDGEDEDDDESDDEEEPDEDDEADDGADRNATETDDDDESLNETADEDDDANETDVDDGGDDEEEADGEDDDEEEDDDDEGDRGFTVVELGGATVDLTQVIDEDAIAVFDGEIPAGSYEKIELEVSAVSGIVDGSEVDVKLPSEKLQITNEFEVAPDEAVSFVFDINVVKRGKNNGYILKPVISGSGVAGRDVEVNEIDDEDDDDAESEGSDDEEGSDDGETADDDSDGDDATGGNETDDAANGTAAGS